MIHSMSGGMIAENAVVTFAKVQTEEGALWFVAPEKTEAGEEVLVPVGREERLVRGRVLKTEHCTPHTAPVPLSRAREIFSKA